MYLGTHQQARPLYTPYFPHVEHLVSVHVNGHPETTTGSPVCQHLLQARCSPGRRTPNPSVVFDDLADLGDLGDLEP